MITQWLNDRVRGFAHLGEDERQAIADFALLWSLFEARIMDTRATPAKIVELTEAWAAAGEIDEQTFGEALAYFRGRYRRDGVFTEAFEHLHLERGGREDLVQGVLEGEGGVAEQAACVLSIILRYRNNLFHGEKWRYRLAGQRDNFDQANRALMIALERFGRLDRD